MSDRPSKVFYQFKLVLLGDSGVGKSSLLNRYMDEGFFPNQPCTINADFKIKSLTIDEFSSAQITIWDTCDVADKRSFADLDIWLEEIKKNTIKEDLSIILVGNKIDLKFRNIKTEDAKNFADKNNLLYCETSSKEGLNVNNAFEMITKEIINKQNNSNICEQSSNIKNIGGKEKKREKEITCC